MVRTNRNLKTVIPFLISMGWCGCIGGSSVPPNAPESGGTLRLGGSPTTGGVAAPNTGGRTATGGVAGSDNEGSGGTTTIHDAAVNGDVPQATGGQIIDASPTTSDTHVQGVRPNADAKTCGAWAMTEGVCCAQYCKNDNKSESCDKCGGPGSAQCEVVNAKACTSGQWPEIRSVNENEEWRYSRSTHFGTAPTGACAFGLYGICSASMKMADTTLQARCDVFCKAYPDLCKDPTNSTFRGNFAAPQGNYYSQFWPSLPGDLDNYLSCGECFQLVRTEHDGTVLSSGVNGYTPPIVLTIADSCPCAANSKWCCGSGRDHCGEIEGIFKYGCPLSPTPAPPLDHDPLPTESIHFDLSDIAMSRLQSGDPNGAMPAGVVPTQYRRVPCPVTGNIHVWMRPNASEYYFALTVVNMAGLGAATMVDAQLPSGNWVAMQRDTNYSLSRPQERFGTWALPQGTGPFSLPVTLRITDGSGRAIVAKDAIKAWAPEEKSLNEIWFIDIGVQF